MVSEIVRLLRQPKILRFVSFVSAVVGFLCFSVSSSFNHLFGNWNLLKIILYTFFSFIICLAIFFANEWQNSPSLQIRAHLVFSVFTITTVYSYFFDKANGKPDVYSLVSGAAFAIMSLGLSKQSHFGFEVDLLYFFCGYLTLQFMKIKLFLVIAGVIFSYPLIILRFYLNAPTEYSEELTNTADYHVIQVDDSQVNFDSLVAPEFDALPDSLTLVSQINSPSQQVNVADTDSNNRQHPFPNLLSLRIINPYSNLRYLWPINLPKFDWNAFTIFCYVGFDNKLNTLPNTYHIRWLEEFENRIRKVVDVDLLSTERPSALVQTSTIVNIMSDFPNLNNLTIPSDYFLGFRHRRGSKLNSRPQLKERVDASVENNDVVQDYY